jgi:hypothetical protein
MPNLPIEAKTVGHCDYCQQAIIHYTSGENEKHQDPKERMHISKQPGLKGTYHFGCFMTKCRASRSTGCAMPSDWRTVTPGYYYVTSDF